MKLGRSMQAKQVFSEKLLKENKRLNEIVDQQKGLLVVNRDIPDGQAIKDKTNVDENATTSATNAISNKEQEKMVEEKEKVKSEQTAKIKDMEKKIEGLSKQIAELSTEVAKTNEGKQKVESELSETAKNCSYFQTKCAGFFNQVVGLNSKQQESEEEISFLKRARENLRAQLAEKDAMMRDSLRGYEDDLEMAQQESGRLRRENQSHTVTIRDLESEIQRLNRMLDEERILMRRIPVQDGSLF
ncbi:Hypothetical predicted protein [Paramuricea clavata]|uniref:Uncharacterized protein n=1 Tax=Paramuricea clavata TaxID=317549 RepID=A0A6S7JGS0_PARCT|nr:Hypothetical predicted protein [Paramuricea clavata]